MTPSGIITLTTDFGASDWFVGTMKGVILGTNPGARIIDITHQIPAGDIRAGAFALAASCRFFPKGAVHLGVVDPGVGSRRKAIAVQTQDYFFVAPDNGLLSWALRKEQVKAIQCLENPAFFLRTVSQTFHGRDIFAPVAAHLSRGLPMQKLGPAQKSFVRLAWPEPNLTRESIEGEIIYIDHFGNAITNIDQQALQSLSRSSPEVFIGRKRICSVAPFYAAVPAGKPVAVLGSSGFLEIAINGGNAARHFTLREGDRFALRRR